MSAKKKAIIAIIIGAVIGVAMMIYLVTNASEMSGVSEKDMMLQGVLMIPCFMLYAFGYAFGWKRCKGFLAGAAKVSADIGFISIIGHMITGKGLGRGLMISMFVFCFAIGIIWLPGVVFGIKDLISERKGAYA